MRVILLINAKFRHATINTSAMATGLNATITALSLACLAISFCACLSSGESTVSLNSVITCSALRYSLICDCHAVWRCSSWGVVCICANRFLQKACDFSPLVVGNTIRYCSASCCISSCCLSLRNFRHSWKIVPTPVTLSNKNAIAKNSVIHCCSVMAFKIH